jgi:glycerate 2-kinase
MGIDPSRLLTASLKALPWGEKAARVMAAALDAADPESAVLRFLKLSQDRLEIAGKQYDLGKFRRILVVGAGKAGAPMLKAVQNILGDRVDWAGVIVKEGHTLNNHFFPTGLNVFEAGHPVPDERGIRATTELANVLSNSGEHDLIICLISGGGSALMTAPAPDISLDDMQALTTNLLASGANINEINTVRKHLDLVKGGGLARMASPAHLVALILSDVVGDPLDIIASGPTVSDPGTFADAWKVLKKYSLTESAGPAISGRLRRGVEGKYDETPKPGDSLFKNVQNVIVGSNRQAVEAGLRQARAEGFHPILLTTRLTGEARRAGPILAEIARQAADRGKKPLCLAAGGETTVKLKGNGKGGRNQELALSAVRGMSGLSGTTLASLATDGGDGPTDAAGAVVTGETYEHASLSGLDPSDFLERNDAYHFFEHLDDLIKSGPTLTNVNDLTFLLVTHR